MSTDQERDMAEVITVSREEYEQRIFALQFLKTGLGLMLTVVNHQELPAESCREALKAMLLAFQREVT